MRDQKRGEEERKREEEEEEEEGEEEEGRREAKQAKVWNLGFLYGTINSCMNFHTIAWLLVVPKPRVLLGFHLNPIIMEDKVGKTLDSIRST